MQGETPNQAPNQAQNQAPNQAQNAGQGGSSSAAQSEQKPVINLVRQYVKNLNMNVEIDPLFDLLAVQDQPTISVNLSVEGMAFGEDLYEAQISVTASATLTDQTKLFEVTLHYGGLFKLSQIPESDLEPLLLVYCPGIIFPFARRVISDVTRDAGFPPLLLDLVDFAKLYQDKLAAHMDTAA